ncbi:unnamed protein product, partial [Wuchereria bancrofti]
MAVMNNHTAPPYYYYRYCYHYYRCYHYLAAATAAAVAASRERNGQMDVWKERGELRKQSLVKSFVKQTATTTTANLTVSTGG